jgi:hypothetical protein
MSPKEEHFLTPGDLCERWNVDWKTLNKLPLPWVRVTPNVRRIELTFVLKYEQAQRLSTTSS